MPTYITECLRSTTLEGLPVTMPACVYVDFAGAGAAGTGEHTAGSTTLLAYRLTPLLFAHLVDLCEQMDGKHGRGELSDDKINMARERMESIWRAANAELDVEAVAESRRLLVSDPERFTEGLEVEIAEARRVLAVGAGQAEAGQARESGETIQTDGEQLAVPRDPFTDPTVPSLTPTEHAERLAALRYWGEYNAALTSAAKTAKASKRTVATGAAGAEAAEELFQ